MKASYWLTTVISATLLLVTLAHPQDNAPEDDTYPVRIILEPRPDARFYQVEWLEGNEISGEEEAPTGSSLREKVTRTEIKRNLPLRFRYFRLRSAYRDGLYGPWGEVVEIQRPTRLTKKETDRPGSGKKPGSDTTAAAKPVKKKSTAKHSEDAKPVEPQDVFAQVIDKDGKEKWVLRGKSVAAERLDQTSPLWYDVECLSEKDAPENTNGRRRYEGPVPFTRAGQYRMNLYNTEDTTQNKPLQTWIFWVYTDVPRTYVKFYAPFLHGRGGFIVGGKTKISLSSQFAGAAIDRIDYRVFAEGSTPGAWQKYEDDIEVASFAKGQYGYYNIEYRATNVAGSVEPPQIRRMLIDSRGPTIEERAAEDGSAGFTFADEHFPVVVRIYQNGALVQDIYFKQWKANENVRAPAASGYEIRAIDLLGNETILKK
ncbi:MAG: hypothetical protein ACOY5B_17920 [Spirochaetota bacterium]